MNFKTYKLFELLTQYRITHFIKDNQDYKQATISKFSGVSYRGTKNGKLIGRKRQFFIDLKKFPNTLLFTRQGVKDGSIGIAKKEVDGCIVTENMPMFSINTSIIEPKLLDFWLKSKEFRVQVASISPTGTAQKSIHERDLLEISITIPDNISDQKKLEQNISYKQNNIDQINVEITTQTTLLSQLRQAILQEAIEGKLTADWRKENPIRKGDPDFDAEALLKKIKIEKEKLIKEGKIKKQKPLAEIKAEEVPFGLPEGWVWTRLGNTSEGFQYGSSAKSLKDGKVPVLRMGNIQDGKIDWNGLVYTNNKNEIEQYVLKKGDLLFNRTNSRELVGKTAAFDGLRDAIFAGYLIRFSPLAKCSSEYFNFIMNSTLHREWCNQNKTDAIGQSNINATKLRDFLFPLAPLAEQQAIVDRVEKLLSMVDELEKQVSERKEQAEQLMQAVLREAFEPAAAGR